MNLIQFRLQKAIFTFEETSEGRPADHNCYQPLKDKRFYVDPKVNVLKDAIAWFVEKTWAYQAKKTITKV